MMKRLLALAAGVLLAAILPAATAVYAASDGVPGNQQSAEATQVVPLLPFQAADQAQQAVQAPAGEPEALVDKTPQAAINWNQMEAARALNRDRAKALKRQIIMERDQNQAEQPAE